MSLETMTPDPDYDQTPHTESIETFRRVADDLTVRVWGGDWCRDCRAVLPQFAAAIEAAGVPPDAVNEYPVEKEADGTKVGPLVESYEIAYIPTIVIERDGEEVARFVESAAVSPVEFLAEQLARAEPAN